MIFSVGDIISIKGIEYRIVGKITYRNTSDNCRWDEYRMMAMIGGREAWLSIDDVYREYSISSVKHFVNKNGYHEVDRGREVAERVDGNVDVDVGDAAFFTEYEDVTEEKIISEEVWDDGVEYSEGYYLDEDEIVLVRSEPRTMPTPVSNSNISYSSGKAGKSFALGFVIVAVLVISMPMLVSALNGIIFKTSIADYLNKDSGYTYVTSITGEEKQKADVYKAETATDVDTAAKDIINAIKGETEYVQQDTDTETDGSIAIMTANEYCIVYKSEDNESILVQVSSRQYTYTTDKDLYHGTKHSRRYYRRFYYSTGYTSDTSRYSGYSSPYSSFTDSGISYNSSNTYNSYSGSVRQSSIRSRSSSGGGISSGK